MEHKIWSINLSELPTKDFKMYEDEAKELLKKYEQEYKEEEVELNHRSEWMYNASKSWNESFLKCTELKIKIARLKDKMDDKEEEDE
jgi:hypothetical protein